MKQKSLSRIAKIYVYFREILKSICMSFIGGKASLWLVYLA
jgi:hypothetical protein